MAGDNVQCGLGRPIRILVINPNSSQEMTRGMVAAVDTMNTSNAAHISSYTAPASSPASINNDADIRASDQAVYADIAKGNLNLSDYDATLIACFSVHSLVPKIYNFGPVSVTGIFEASITTAQLVLRPHSSDKWGIVTTGKFWEEHLTEGVKSFLGQERESVNRNFAGVFSTGLNASDFHVVSKDEVTSRLRGAAQRLFQAGDVRCVVMGCAGMAGLETIIRSTAIDMFGKEKGSQLYVVDGVKAGVLQLEEMVRSKQIFG